MGEQSPTSPNTGNVRIYINQGTNVAPVFGNYSVVYAGSGQLYKYRANPVVYDLDTDGLKDLIVGCDDGRVYFYKNIGTNAAPVFAATYDTLKTQNGLAIDAGYGSRIHFVDWNGDGDLDLLISGFDGYIEYYENASPTGVFENEQQLLTIKGPDITPNPIARTGRVSYSLEYAAHVRIDVFTVDGRLIATPVDKVESGGQHEFMWNAQDSSGRKLPAGIYLVRLTSGSQTNTKNIIITR